MALNFQNILHGTMLLCRSVFGKWRTGYFELQIQYMSLINSYQSETGTFFKKREHALNLGHGAPDGNLNLARVLRVAKLDLGCWY